MTLSYPPFDGVLAPAVQLWSKHLELELKKAREKITHRGERGSANERAFRDFLRAHLPPKYRVGTGEVTDAQGQRSKQVDVMIADDEQPFPVDDNSELLIIEGISAAAEVKTVLTASALADCVEKGRAFKKLQANLGTFLSLEPFAPLDGQPNIDFLRYYKRRAFFVFAYECDVSEEKMAKLLTASHTAEDGVPSIDAVFLLDKGTIFYLWDGRGRTKYADGVTGKPYVGWLYQKGPEKVLVNLLFWLHSVMPRFAIRSSPLLAYLVPGAMVPDIMATVPTQMVPHESLRATFLPTPYWMSPPTRTE